MEEYLHPDVVVEECIKEIAAVCNLCKAEENLSLLTNYPSPYYNDYVNEVLETMKRYDLLED